MSDKKVEPLNEAVTEQNAQNPQPDAAEVKQSEPVRARASGLRGLIPAGSASGGGMRKSAAAKVVKII